jgi:solute carrier family 35 protein E1
VFLYVTLSGAVFYFYNYVSFQCLHYLTPSENSVANTAKRAIIIFGDAAWYNKIVTLEQYIGSSVCIVGVCLYGMIDELMKKPTADAKAAGPKKDAKLILLLTLWYVGNFFYSVWNKDAGKWLDTPAAVVTLPPVIKSQYSMSLAAVQLLVGVVISVGIWSFDPSKLPGCTVADLKKLLPLALCNAGAHSASVFALAAGGVAFGQIVKAAEPVFAAGITTAFYSAKISTGKWVCLVPIIGGIAFSMLTLDEKWHPIIDSNFFSLGGLIGALIANAFAAFKGAEQGKLKHDEGLKARMGGEANQYAVVNILSFLVSVPLMVMYPVLNGKSTASIGDNISIVFTNPFSNLSVSFVSFYLLSYTTSHTITRY